jgi:hypothetical protein
MQPAPALRGFRFLGWGPRATGSYSGWATRSDLYGRCGRCTGLVSLWPDQIEQCSCGALFKDLGRFGHLDGDQSIAIYSKDGPTP